MKSLSTKQQTSCTAGDAGSNRQVQKVGGFEHETIYFLHRADAARLTTRQRARTGYAPVVRQARSGGNVGGMAGLL